MGVIDENELTLDRCMRTEAFKNGPFLQVMTRISLALDQGTSEGHSCYKSLLTASKSDTRSTAISTVSILEEQYFCTLDHEAFHTLAIIVPRRIARRLIWIQNQVGCRFCRLRWSRRAILCRRNSADFERHYAEDPITG
jgi:hypothetical protein